MLPIINTGRSRRGWSYFGNFRVCPRKHAFAEAVRDGTLPAPDTGGVWTRADVGTAIHGFLAVIYRARMEHTTFPSIGDIAQALKGAGQPAPAVEEAQEAIQVTLPEILNDPWEPIAVEQEFWTAFLPVRPGVAIQVPPGTPGAVDYSTRIDVVFRDSSGGVYPTDTKTSTQVRQRTSDRYGVHGQIHGLYWLGRANFGDAFRGVRVHLVQSIAPHKIKRMPPPNAPRMVEGFPALVCWTAWEIAQHRAAFGADPMAWPSASHETICFGPYRPCDYIATCKGT